MNIQMQYDKDDLREVVEAVAMEMLKGQSQTVSPIDELRNWIRADDLYSRGLFSRPTLVKYHKKGLIGRSTIGGAVFYYIPEILELLRMNHYKPEAIQRISDDLRGKNEDKI
jgi:hypothetical protein